MDLREQNRLKALAFVALLAYFAAGFAGMVIFWSDTLTVYVPDKFQFAEWKSYVVYFFAGVIGGTLYCLRKFYYYQALGRLDLERRWMWYVFNPPIRGGVAAMSIVLFESGILILSVKDSMHAKVGLAFLFGFGFGKVMRKLEDTIVSMFGEDSENGKKQGNDLKDLNGHG